MKICSCKGGCRCTHCDCASYSNLFDSFANKNRLHVISSLRKGEKTVSEIIGETGLEQSAVSHILQKLEQASIVTVHAHGRFRMYRLNSKVVEPMLQLAQRSLT